MPSASPSPDPTSTDLPLGNPADSVREPQGSGSQITGSPKAGSQSSDEAKTVIRSPLGSKSAGGSASDAIDPPRRDGILPNPPARSPAEVARGLVGSSLNHFRIDQLIGGGGMGAVFLAHDERLARDVALKVIPFADNQPELQRRTRNEAQSAAKLDHPQIAKVFEAGEDKGWQYIVFEYVEGTNIRDQVADNGPMSIDDAIYITAKLAGALQHVSDRKIVHRDVKPSNVLINVDGQVKLVDMGLARSENLELSEDMTASGATLGTFDYISPEQASDPRDADLRSDLYSLGCTLYYMLTGQPPYPGGTMLQKLLAHGKEPPPDARLQRPEVSADLHAVLEKLLAKDPDSRYQRAGDLVADLTEIAYRENHSRLQQLQSRPDYRPSKFREVFDQHGPWLVAASVLLCSGIFLASRDGQQMQVDVPALATSAVLPQPLTSLSESSSNGASPTNGGQKPIDIEVPGGGDAISDAVRTAPDASATTASIPTAPMPTPLIDERESWESLRFTTTGLRDEANEEFLVETVNIVEANEQFPLGSLRGNRESSAVRVTQLSDALSVAYATDVDTITLDCKISFSRAISTPPPEIRDDIPRRLTLKSSVNGSVVQFADDSFMMNRALMWNAGLVSLTLEDVHLVWMVDETPFDGGTLIRMDAGSTCIFRRGSVTLDNPKRVDGLTIFEIGSPPDPTGFDPVIASLPGQSTDDDFPLTAFTFEEVILRGATTAVEILEPAKLWWRWTNGFAALDGRLIEISPDVLEKTSDSGPSLGTMQLTMLRTTIDCRMGIMLASGIDRGGDVPARTYRIKQDANNCVFVMPQRYPLYELEQWPLEPLSADAQSLLEESSFGRNLLEMGNVDQKQIPVGLIGSGNIYVTDDTMSAKVLSISDQGGKTVSATLDVVQSQPLPWAEENGIESTIEWSSINGDPRQSVIPRYERGVEDYLHRASDSAGIAEDHNAPPSRRKESDQNADLARAGDPSGPSP